MTNYWISSGGGSNYPGLTDITAAEYGQLAAAAYDMRLPGGAPSGGPHIPPGTLGQWAQALVRYRQAVALGGTPDARYLFAGISQVNGDGTVGP